MTWFSVPLMWSMYTVTAATDICGMKGEDTTPFPTSGSKIVNGQDATPCEWPWQVSLRTSTGFHFCGGTLISQKWVITAAHCINNYAFVVVLGDHNRNSDSDQFATIMNVASVSVHPEYNQQTFDNDFALVEVQNNVIYNECISPVCISELPVGAGVECYITGWGTLSSGGSSPSFLQEGKVATLSNDACDQMYGGQITSTMICAQGVTPTGQIVDACQGDSGGPLVCAQADGSFVLEGVTSWGYGCAQANYPGVWSRVSTAFHRIHHVMGTDSTTISTTTETSTEAWCNVENMGVVPHSMATMYRARNCGTYGAYYGDD